MQVISKLLLKPPSSDRWGDQLECFETLEKQKGCEIIVADFEQGGLDVFCQERNLKRSFGLETLKDFPSLFLFSSFLSSCFKLVDDESDYIVFLAGDVYLLEDNLLETVSWVLESKDVDSNVCMMRAYNVPELAVMSLGCMKSRQLNYPGIHVFVFKRETFEQVKLSIRG